MKSLWDRIPKRGKRLIETIALAGVVSLLCLAWKPFGVLGLGVFAFFVWGVILGN